MKESWLFMHSEFAYSGEMRFILAIISYASTFIFMYLIADLIMWVYNGKASRRQKLLLALVTGPVMQSTFVYAIYFIGGTVPFSKTAYLLITTPNPIFALLYCYFGIKILKLSQVRSIKIMGKFYLYYIFVRAIYRLIGSIFFMQTEMRYNYMLDAVQQCICIIATFMIYFITRYFLNQLKVKMSVSDILFVDLHREILIYVTRSFLGWLSFILIPLFVSEPVAANVINVIVILFMLLNYILVDYSHALEVTAENNEAYIHALSSGMDSFSSVKHDFYNILQTYSGYLEVGDLEKLKAYHFSLVQTTMNAGNSVELGKRLDENPALVSLLINKLEFAEKCNVKLKILIQCEMDELYIDDIDICRAISCLLDNAIEAASLSDRKTVLMTIEDKSGQSKLIVISNSANAPVDTGSVVMPGIIGKDGHMGTGLTTVRRIVEKYGNCVFRLSVYQDEFTAYLETRKNV